jgi:quinol monooxygenase YgiN
MLTRREFQGLCLSAGLLLALVQARAADDKKEDPILANVKTRVKDPKKQFTLVIRLKVKEGSAEKFEAAFAKASRETHKEKGCIAYDLNRDTEDAARYVVYERWKNLAALEEHLKSDYIKALLAALPELLDGAPEPSVLLPAAE